MKKNPPSFLTAAAFGALGACTFAAPAVAQVNADALNQKVWLQIGAYRPDIDSEIRLDNTGSDADGTPLNLEDTLALPKKKTLGSALLGVRFADRWRAEFEYFSLKRSGRTDPLGGPIDFGDATYTSEVDTTFDSKVYRASIGYSFFREPEIEAGVVFGVHVTDFKVALRGTGTVDGVPTTVATEAADKTVPLPTLGLYGTWGFGAGWLAGARVDVLKIKLKGMDGELINAQANLQYRFTPNIGLGAGYRYNNYKLDGDRDSFQGHLKYTYKGPQVFVDLGF